MKKRICKNICIMLLSVFLLNGCKTEPVEENDATEYSEAIYTCEVVEDITQEEIVCFDNLLFRCGITCNWSEEGEVIGIFDYYLFVFEDGSVYCGKEKYRLGCNVWDIYNCVDTGWGNLEEVYYLGNFSEEDLGEINCFLASVDLRSEIVVYDEPETVPCLVENDEITNIIWKSRGFRIIYENEDGDLEVFDVEGRGVENGREEISYQTTDENALALKHFVEESSFYTTWLELIFEGAE